MTQPPNGPQPGGANPYAQPGYPPAGQPGYPPGPQPSAQPPGSPSGPQQPMRQAQPGYPPPPGYPHQQQGLPPQQQRYAPQQQGYPPQQQGYATQQGYGAQQQGYSPQQSAQRPAAQQTGVQQTGVQRSGTQQTATQQRTHQQAPAQKKPKGSPGLGALGLLLVVIAGIVGLGTTYFLGRAIGWTTAAATIVKNCVQNVDVDTCEAQTDKIPEAVAVLHQLELGGTVLGAAVLVGLIAWILCIVAAATRRGKGLGVTGIILGIIFVLAITGATIGFWAYFNANSIPPT